jgi:hypothetical protein
MSASEGRLGADGVIVRLVPPPRHVVADGRMVDLGTLGGPQSSALAISDHGTIRQRE